MRQSKSELLQHILSIDDNQELYKLKHKLETKPFCGVEQCYDLERFIFHMLSIEERQLIITHIRNISKDVQKQIHIFTTYDYYNQCSEKIKYFLKVNSNYITILNKNSEIYEIALRNTNNENISFISDVDLRIEQKGIIPLVLNIDELNDDIVSQSLADLYLRIIINYIDIFPEFIPLYIDFATNANIILSHKLNEIEDSKNIAGCILDNSKQLLPKNFENRDLNIYFFERENDFLKIFVNNILK
jgi:hypothetical protein